MLAFAFWGRSLASPGYLTEMAAHSAEILGIALAALCMGLACAGIGLSLYPVLKRHSEAQALAAAGFRIMEGTIQVVSAISIIALLAVSQEFVKAGSPPDSFFQPLAAAIKSVREWVLNGAFLLPWCIGAFFYYRIFFKTRLVPRWLSVWGLIGLALMLAGAFTSMFGLLGLFSAAQFLLMLPILIQEMVLAVWLIVKGYREEGRTV
jgi:hypothetical protein